MVRNSGAMRLAGAPSSAWATMISGSSTAACVAGWTVDAGASGAGSACATSRASSRSPGASYPNVSVRSATAVSRERSEAGCGGTALAMTGAGVSPATAAECFARPGFSGNVRRLPGLARRCRRSTWFRWRSQPVLSPRRWSCPSSAGRRFRGMRCVRPASVPLSLAGVRCSASRMTLSLKRRSCFGTMVSAGTSPLNGSVLPSSKCCCRASDAAHAARLGAPGRRSHRHRIRALARGRAASGSATASPPRATPKPRKPSKLRSRP